LIPKKASVMDMKKDIILGLIRLIEKEKKSWVIPMQLFLAAFLLI